MSKNLKNQFEETVLNIDSGARFLSNGPMFLAVAFLKLIVAVISIVRVVFPFLSVFALTVGAYQEALDLSIRDFELGTYIKFTEHLISNLKANGTFNKVCLMILAVLVIVEVVLTLIRKRLSEIYSNIAYVRYCNKETIKENNEYIKNQKIRESFGTHHEYLKDNLKDFKKSSNYVER